MYESAEKESVIFERFFSINLDLLCIANTDGIFIKVNKAWENILGYAVEELEGRNFLEFVHPDDMDDTLKAMTNLDEQKPVLNFINRYKCKDESYRYIEWRSQPYGKLIYAAARDITDKIEKQAVIEEKESNFRTFFETIDDLIFVATAEGRILHCNTAVTKKLGYREEELNNMHVLDVHPEIYRPEAEDIFTDMFKGLRDYCPLPLKKKDGGFLPVETRVWFGKWDGVDCIYGISKDLSKQQAALEKFYKVFESNPALMAVSSISTGKFEEVNDAFMRKLGYTKEEIIGKNSKELRLFVESEKKKQVSDELKENGRICDIELKVRKKDGSILHGLFSGEIIDNQGEKSFLTVMIDITEQRKNERELDKAKTSMKAILDNLPFLAWLKDEKGKFIQVNKEFEKIFGKKEDEIRGRTEYDIWPTKLAEEHMEDDFEIMKLGKQKFVEDMVKDGESVRWVEIFKTPIFDNGNVNGITGIARDITAKKEMEIALMESEERFKQLAEIFPETIYESDLNGNVIYANNHAYGCFGYTEEEVKKGINIINLVSPDDRNIVLERINRKASGQEHGYLEYIAMRKDGTTFPAMGYTAPIMKNGAVVGLRGFILDMTQKKKNELEIVKAKEQAEAANIMKSQFLANMSHEIRTPMNGVLGFLDLLERTYLSAEQKEYIREAKSASEILLCLINDILDFSKIEAGKLNIEKTNFKVRTLIEDAVSILVPKATEKDLEICTMIKSNVPEEVSGDPARLRQILNNLLSNAVKFTDKGEINVTVDCIEEVDGNALLSFEVKDTGIGISENSLNRLFKPFMQADASTTRKYGGTGLGLAISRELVRLMNGDISVESKIGEGSIFRFRVSLKIIKKLKKNTVFEKLQGVNVLTVDDNKSNLRILRSYLENEGCNVFEADGADKAITTILMNSNNKNRISVGIIDYQMPVIDGCQLAATIKAMPFAKNIKLILLTSSARKGDVSLAKEYGFTGYLSKPVRRDELLNCVSMVLGLKQEADSGIEIVTRHTVNEAKETLQSKILLVEDNEMNRKIVIKMLKYKNITCDIAGNGKEALEAVAEKDYDIVFMDCQMPVMDGYESTAKIREMEGDKKHTTIIAMTANAMEGDRIKCIEAGMDDYISKPINFDIMFNMIEGNTRKRKQEDRKLTIIDDNIDRFIEFTGLEKEEAEELFMGYLEYLPNILKEVRIAIDNSDFDKLRKLAHELKGASGNFRVNSIYELAIELENSALKEDCERCGSLLIEIETLYK